MPACPPVSVCLCLSVCLPVRPSAFRSRRAPSAARAETSPDARVRLPVAPAPGEEGRRQFQPWQSRPRSTE
eukprot:12047292-Alexandrium_andersonii.AAC.1